MIEPLVLHPFPDVAGHVEQIVGIVVLPGLEAAVEAPVVVADRRRAEFKRVPASAVVRVRVVDRVPSETVDMVGARTAVCTRVPGGGLVPLVVRARIARAVAAVHRKPIPESFQ